MRNPVGSAAATSRRAPLPGRDRGAGCIDEVNAGPCNPRTRRRTAPAAQRPPWIRSEPAHPDRNSAGYLLEMGPPLLLDKRQARLLPGGDTALQAEDVLAAGRPQGARRPAGLGPGAADDDHRLALRQVGGPLGELVGGDVAGVR